MRVVFLGGLFSKEKELFFLSRSKSNFQVAANTLQWSLVRGLDQLAGTPIDIVTIPFVGDFPRDYRDLVVGGHVFERGNSSLSHSIGFLNLKLINILSKFIECRRVLRRVIDESADGRDRCLVVYGLFVYLVAAAVSVKGDFPNVRVCVVVPDLPDMMGGDNSRWVIRLFNYINRRLLNKVLPSVDCFVLLSKYMADRLPIGDRPWCVVEGVAEPRDVSDREGSRDEFVVLYTGTLARRYGVIDLVNAFSCIPDKKFRLKVCGVGDGLANILAATKIDRRIEYMGQLPRDEVLRLQESADLLINPRTSDGEYTRYSFPSKVMEYFASGTPTVMHRLPGIPDDYFKHCIVPPTEDAEGLTQAILIASSLGHAELRRIGLGARDFILSEKSAVQQCQKIVQLIDRC